NAVGTLGPFLHLAWLTSEGRLSPAELATALAGIVAIYRTLGWMGFEAFSIEVAVPQLRATEELERYRATAQRGSTGPAVHRPDAQAIAVDAAAAAGLDDLIDQLPNGWLTTLAPEVTGGVDLSGGQWQRVALARAFYGARVGRNTMLLDEPTSNLDIAAEMAL